MIFHDKYSTNIFISAMYVANFSLEMLLSEFKVLLKITKIRNIILIKTIIIANNILIDFAICQRRLKIILMIFCCQIIVN